MAQNGYDSLALFDSHSGQLIARYVGVSDTIKIKSLCPVPHTLFLYSGLNTVAMDIDLSAQQDTLLEWPIADHLLTSVQVVANAPVYSSTLYLRENTSRQRSSLAQILTELPGMTTLQSGSNISKPVFFGFTGYRIVLYKNNLRLEGQQWGMDHGPEINPWYAGKIELLHGAKALFQAGDAVGGIIKLYPPVMADSLNHSINWRQSFSSNGRQHFSSLDYHHQPKRLPHLLFRISGTWNRSGNVQTPKGTLNNTGLSERTTDASIWYTRKKWRIGIEHGIYKNELGIFSGSHSGNLTDLYNRIHSPELPEASFTYSIHKPSQSIYHETSQLNTQIDLSEKWKFNLLLGRQFDQRKEYDAHSARNDSIAALNTPSLHLNLTDYQSELQAHHSLNTNLSVHACAGIHTQKNTFEGRFYLPNYRKHISLVRYPYTMLCPFIALNLPHVLSIFNKVFTATKTMSSLPFNPVLLNRPSAFHGHIILRKK